MKTHTTGTNGADEVPFRVDAQRWAAVLQRDLRADGHFFYSVRTTGVYCRPSCAARRPRREHVQFHATSQAAEQAGFRPCRRCRPTEPSLSRTQAAAVAAACRLIESADEMPTLDALARTACLSRFHFHRVFRSITGVTPRAYAAAHRARRVREELQRSATVTDAIYAAGFSTSSRFYEAAPALLGMTPGRFRAGGKGVVVRFAIGDCSLGSVLVAATEKGICSIMLGDSPQALRRDLERRFPHAQLVTDSDFDRLVSRVVALVEAPGGSFNLPLDIRGTAFQQKVWEALRAIPAGATASYTEVARRIGAPAAVRGVARACADNPVAVAIPCHRVVRADGGLAGYRWGLERKRALLERERTGRGSRPEGTARVRGQRAAASGAGGHSK